MYIYLIVNHVTGKYYIGQHKGNNLKKYLQTKISDANKNRGGRSYLYASMRKHPKKAWSIHALLSDVQTRTELDQHERDFISFLKSQDPKFGYNICRGGEGRTGPLSPEEKIKFRLNNQKYWDKHKHDLVGQTFGKLTVLSEAESRKNKHSGWKSKRQWNCQCACGNLSVVTTNALKSSKGIRSCGCLIAEAGRNRWAKQEMIGKIFSRLTVESEAGRNKNKQRMWNCSCTCGNVTVVRTNSLMMETVKSCGCLALELARRKKTPEHMKNCHEAHKSPARQEAITKGETFYFTGKPCKHGHISPRRVKNGACRDCEKQKRVKCLINQGLKLDVSA